MTSLLSNVRRLSRSSSKRKSDQDPGNNLQSPTGYQDLNSDINDSAHSASNPQYQQHSQQPEYSPQNRHAHFSRTAPGHTSLRDRALGGSAGPGATNRTSQDGRPLSNATDQSFDYRNRPLSGTTAGVNTTSNSSGGVGVNMNSRGAPVTGAGRIGLSRTDQIVLQHFWEQKYLENNKRDLHYLKFPFFPQYPNHKDLLPYCEIYHLVKTSPGATIISLGSANGVYIGFELQTGSQLHIDLDDEWFSPPLNHTPTSHTTSSAGGASSITHNRISFRPYNSLISDPDAGAVFRTWPKPLTIEYLEEQYQMWCKDLMSICWESREVRELGPGGSAGDGAPATSGAAGAGAGVGGTSIAESAGGVGERGMDHHYHDHMSGGSQIGGESMVDDGYASEHSGI